MAYKHGGNLSELARLAGCLPEQIVDFSANINPLGPPSWLRQVLSRQVENLIHYPSPRAEEFVQKVADCFEVASECVVAGNGSSELLYALLRILPAQRAVVSVPCYGDYITASEQAGLEVVYHYLKPEDDFKVDLGGLSSMLQDGDVVFVGQPNNPTGVLTDSAALRKLARACETCWFVIDEAFGDFIEGFDSLIGDCPANVIVLRSMTKFYAIPGLRLGFAVMDAVLAGRLRESLPPWSVNTFAQEVGRRVLEDAGYGQGSRRLTAELREELEAELTLLPGVKVYPGTANYVFGCLEGNLNAPKLAERLLREQRIAIRVCDNYEGLDRRHFRVAVRPREENERLLAALASVLTPEVRRPARIVRKHKPALMMQGTTSNAGKSIMAAAFCRIMLQDGLRVAPFKAQNMSLNSFVTRDGGEMGRAQVVQAQACHLDPDVCMNPVLLKPNSDTGSQVILMGKPIGNMNVLTYTEYKSRLRETVHQAYDDLASEMDAVVLEGAGSPAEVNLKKHDLVNMQMARYAQSPVVLVGDIDRGGVYAHFVGTMEVMEEWERRLLAGFLVNRFRGDASLLGSAHEYVLNHTGRRVLGVVPYLKNLNVPEEDSVEFKNGSGSSAATRADAVDIAVIDLPHISNFTDFDPFRIEPDVNLRVVRSPEKLGHPDAVLLPGSKNVPGDLQALRQSGLAGAVLNLAEKGTVVAGICGGFQMLGKTIADPHGLEAGEALTLEGLGLLDVNTVLAADKTLTLTEAVHRPSGQPVRGYEIHHGQTDVGGAEPVFLDGEGRQTGVGTADGRIWGSYLHGVFDADEFRRWFVDQLRSRRGLDKLGTVQAHYDIESALDRLADTVRNAVDMDEIYRLMGV